MGGTQQGLTLITPTGARPEAWALCQRWMARQTYQGPVRWIIVDDGPQAQEVTFQRQGWELVVLRPTPFWRLRQNTQGRNFMKALELVDSDDWVAIIEDDDWYSPLWLERVVEELQHAELVGQGWNRYYNVRSGAVLVHDNAQHASLCASAFRGRALGSFRRIANDGPTLMDVPLWRTPGLVKRVFDGMYVVGMKGMPGRGGIASGHKLETDEPFDLREWIGDDADAYLPFR